jgi:DinB family protein
MRSGGCSGGRRSLLFTCPWSSRLNTISLLRAQLDGSFDLINEVAGETSDAEWTAQVLPDMNPPGFTLWHCARCIDWAVNCEIRGVPEVADQPRWKGRLAQDGWFGYDVSLEKACQVAATVSRPVLVEYAGDLRANVTSWLDTIAEDDLDGEPDLEKNYRSNGTYMAVPLLQTWIKEDAGTPTWRLLTGACIGHVRTHTGEVRALNQILRKPVGTPD